MNHKRHDRHWPNNEIPRRSQYWIHNLQVGIQPSLRRQATNSSIRERLRDRQSANGDCISSFIVSFRHRGSGSILRGYVLWPSAPSMDEWMCERIRTPARHEEEEESKVCKPPKRTSCNNVAHELPLRLVVAQRGKQRHRQERLDETARTAAFSIVTTKTARRTAGKSRGWWARG